MTTETNGHVQSRADVLKAMDAAGWKVRETNRGPYWITVRPDGSRPVLNEAEAVEAYCADHNIPVPPVEPCGDPVQELRQAAGDLVVSDVVANTSNSDLEFAALRKISDANKVVREKEKVYEARKDEASKAKKELEASQERLSRIIEDVTTSETMPLFDPPADAAHAAVDGDGISEVTDDMLPSLEWRGILIEEVLAGIKPASIIQALAEAGITTLGAYADYRAKNKMTDVAGIGESKAAKIEAAEAAFWERWKQAQQQAQVEGLTEAQADPAAEAGESLLGPKAVDVDTQAVEAEKEVACGAM